MKSLHSIWGPPQGILKPIPFADGRQELTLYESKNRNDSRGYVSAPAIHFLIGNWTPDGPTSKKAKPAIDQPKIIVSLDSTHEILWRTSARTKGPELE